ncbi:bifunctional rhamnulose-1-phosphate aldolase/short-chain dehydrogenase [Bythopirellula polymerisocia]|uniref:Diacetyl reductase [(S)-acetoin forming] n=1 Tax=Bythopirellula polymerisocia TaxID=2528003 RepID=A0A5C6D0K8_9BACT|nr:bifunctional rhamnulose-1-phosphate aldolase/short-chain dehydrogenase [Bythopirellula polymerisocia]TWU30248.1 Diacetyl reductase [(S)-acetoin forming] [Bythopirellula polymerisocia]
MSATAINESNVKNLWDDSIVKGMTGVERLVYRSNCLGADQRITNTGGGNTSSKLSEIDPLTGEEIDVMWVKGSGGDLRTSKQENFSSLYYSKLLALQEIYDKQPERGPKTAAEDAMVGYFPHCTFNLNPRASSIDTPLHAFLPAKHIDHMHPNSAIAIAASRRSEELTQEIFGDRIGWVPWLRPGFELGLLMQRKVQEHPSLQGLVMGQHGLINWADDDRECYELTLSLIDKAAQFIDSKDKGEATFGGQKYETLDDDARDAILVELLPWLRGQVCQQKRFIGTLQSDPRILRFVNSHDAVRLAELGTSCPDHFLRTKIKPLYVDWNPQEETTEALKEKLSAGLAQYRQDYKAYYEACKHENSPAMRDPNPTVVLIPGIGMIAWGKNKSESRVTAEFYNCAVEVMRGAEAMDEYIALPQQEAFDIEYWLLEEAKLKRMPPEKELERSIVLVVGAGAGIGKQVAHRLAKEGAHVVCADLNAEMAEATANELTKIYGQGIGVAGTGISGCGPAIGVGVDITNRESIQAALQQTLLAYGGLDNIVVTAGVFLPPSRDGKLSDKAWQLTFDVNVRGSYNLVDEARRIFEEQGLEGSIVLTTSVNGVVGKKGSLAYDTSKAAANHLVRELAIEMSPLVRVNAIAPATVIEGSTMFPRDRVIASLTKYEIPFAESESDEALCSKLAQFYAQRTLTKRPITPADQAEAAYFLLSSKSSKTTGQIINVDGGLHEAFQR